MSFQRRTKLSQKPLDLDYFSSSNNRMVSRFIISPNELFLLPQSVVLSGRLSITASTGSAPADQKIFFDPTTGLHSLIDHITIRSSGTQTVISQDLDYGHFVAMAVPFAVALDETIGQEQQMSYICQRAEPLGLIASKSKVPFCLRLQNGLLQQPMPIPLSREWGVNGLQLEVHWQKPEVFLFGSGTDASNSNWKIEDLLLSYETYIPTPEDIKALTKNQMIPYVDYVVEQRAIQSSNPVVQFSPGKAACLTFTQTYQKTSQSGYASNDFMEDRPGEVSQLSYSINGKRLPFNDDISSDSGSSAQEVLLFAQDSVKQYDPAFESIVNRTQWNQSISSYVDTLPKYFATGFRYASLGMPRDMSKGAKLQVSLKTNNTSSTVYTMRNFSTFHSELRMNGGLVATMS